MLMYTILMPAEAHRSPQRPTEAHRGPQRLTEARRGPQRPTEAHRGSQRPTNTHRGSQRLTEAHRGPQRLTEAHRGPQRLTEAHSLDFLQAQQATSWLYMQEIKRMAERYCDQPMHCAHFASRDHNYGWESNKSLLMHKLIDRDKLHMGASFSQPCVIVMSITITNIVIVMSMAKPFLFVRCTSKVSL
jgi:hypothetical protein